MYLAVEQTFWQKHGDEISAAITLAVAILIAIIVDRVLITRALQATVRMDTGQLSPEARTRLRLIRRLLFLVIILIGVALALSQFTSIKRFATGVLASTAVLGIIIGFAGRQVIANLVAGVSLAITQPIRIGDLVSIGDEVHGRVDRHRAHLHERRRGRRQPDRRPQREGDDGGGRQPLRRQQRGLRSRSTSGYPPTPTSRPRERSSSRASHLRVGSSRSPRRARSCS